MNSACGLRHDDLVGTPFEVDRLVLVEAAPAVVREGAHRQESDRREGDALTSKHERTPPCGSRRRSAIGDPAPADDDAEPKPQRDHGLQPAPARSPRMSPPRRWNQIALQAREDTSTILRTNAWLAISSAAWAANMIDAGGRGEAEAGDRHRQGEAAERLGIERAAAAPDAQLEARPGCRRAGRCRRYAPLRVRDTRKAPSRSSSSLKLSCTMLCFTDGDRSMKISLDPRRRRPRARLPRQRRAGARVRGQRRRDLPRHQRRDPGQVRGAAADLSKILKQPVTVEPIGDYPTLRKGLAAREYDLAFVHPAHLSIARHHATRATGCSR